MRAYEWALAQVWAVTPEMLEVGLSIAQRENLTPEAVEQALGRPLANTYESYTRDDIGAKVAVVPVRGPIFRYANLFFEVSGGVSTELLARDLRTAIDDDSIAAVVMAMDTPGGQATSIAEVAEMIYRGRDRKPIVAYVDGAGASGGLWLASAATAVIASPTAIMGSLGVAMSMRKPDKDGKHVEIVSTHAPNKRVDVSTESGQAEIRRVLDELHVEFESAVARYRGVSVEKVRRDFGRGGVLVGRNAVKAGMADAVGDFESTIRDLAAGRVPGRSRPARSAYPAAAKGSTMSLTDRMKAWLALAPTDEPEATADPAPAPGAHARALVSAVAPLNLRDPETEALRAKLAAYEAKEAARARADIAASAVSLADQAIKDGKATPAERKQLALLHATAAIVAGGHNLRPTFEGDILAVVESDAKPDLSAAVKAAIDARPKLRLGEEAIPSNVGIVSPVRTDNNPSTATDEESEARFQAALTDLRNRRLPSASQNGNGTH